MRENAELDPDFIFSQYAAGPNQTEFQTLAAVSETSDAGNSTEPTNQTSPIFIESIQRSRIDQKNFEFDFQNEPFL